jgi:hypothetical protein
VRDGGRIPAYGRVNHEKTLFGRAWPKLQPFEYCRWSAFYEDARPGRFMVSFIVLTARKAKA